MAPSNRALNTQRTLTPNVLDIFLTLFSGLSHLVESSRSSVGSDITCALYQLHAPISFRSICCESLEALTTISCHTHEEANGDIKAHHTM